MNLSTEKENQHYDKQSGLAGTLYSCEPEGFDGTISPDEMRALSIYYFVDRPVDVDNIYEYRQELATNNPKLVEQAKAALKKVAIAYKIDNKELQDILP